MNMTSKKGQYFSFDAIISSVIFVLALTALLSYWQSTRSILNQQNHALTKETIRLSSLIFTKPQNPQIACDELRFGLQGPDPILNNSLIQQCANRNINISSSYNVSVKVEYIKRNQQLVFGDRFNPKQSSNVVKIYRTATVKNESDSSPVILTLKIYE